MESSTSREDVVIQSSLMIKEEPMEECHILKMESLKKIKLKQQRKSAKKLTCDICEETFIELVKLRGHIIMNHIFTWTEKTTNRVVPPIKILEEFCKSLDEIPDNYCVKCGVFHETRINAKSIVLEDIREPKKSAKKYTCDICEETFIELIKLRTHIIMNHIFTWTAKTTRVVPPLKLLEDFCKALDEIPGNYSVKCDICQTQFTTPEDFRFHKLKRLNFKCKICNMFFCTKQDQQVHNATHREKYPFVCQLCGIGFKSEKSIVKHSKIKHKYPEKIAWKNECSICKKIFLNQNRLQEHIATHTTKIIKLEIEDTQEQYKCYHCSVEFNSKGMFTAHLKNHFKCEQCERKFLTKTTLVRHNQKMHVVKPIVSLNDRYHVENVKEEPIREISGRIHFCDVCLRRFAFKSDLEKHCEVHWSKKKTLFD